MFPFSKHDPWGPRASFEEDGTFQVFGGDGEGEDLLSTGHMMGFDENSSYAGH
jgi:hypothetical protein